MATQYRKAVQEALINDIKLLKHPDDTNKLFAGVAKFLKDFPDSFPYAVLLNTTPRVENIGVDFDNRILGFSLVVFDQLENSQTQAQTEARIDRLSDIEDSIYAYLESIPCPIEYDATGVHAWKIEVLPSQYQYENDQSGIRLYLVVDFNVYITVQV